MRTITDSVGGPATCQNLLVMMPGALDEPDDFFSEGFVRAVRTRHLALDIVALDSHLGYVQGGLLARRLDEDIIAPAKRRGYKGIWLAGISMGALGAMLYTAKHGGIEGIIALAPYLGTRQALAEIDRGGGLAQWDPSTSATMLAWELSLHHWLKAYVVDKPLRPNFILAYGKQDRFAKAHAALAAHLMPDKVIVTAGGHDWPTWAALWEETLNRFASVIAPPNSEQKHA